ncbi:MAG TPA: hypothetical protein PKY29_05590 [Ferruginibacter sp.]|nr:hypothetical protein [Ferruginibacter sp.]HRO16611.1 hypothetical protein [Ferruginibacter sp.]HRQ20767.1 hypothetical protein [Ferruginibacter sp.]
MNQSESIETIRDIRRMMERSSRFISLSGLSGVSAGVCALVGAWIAHPYVYGYKEYIIHPEIAIVQAMAEDYSILFNTWLFWIAVGTFFSAFISAFVFTWIKSKKEGIPVWGNASKRVLASVGIPMIVGGIFLFRLLQFGTFGLVAPACLIFYGLGLVNAAKYTLNEIKYLGYTEIILGLISMWFIGYGLYFWAIGFGLMHIVYGIWMWLKYDYKNIRA